jgi:hypothetical protein
MDVPMTAPTWTYTPQRDIVRAGVRDEQGDLIAVVHNHDNREANQIAALMAAAPRLLAACQSMLAANSTAEIRTALQAAEDAIAATEVSE